MNASVTVRFGLGQMSGRDPFEAVELSLRANDRGTPYQIIISKTAVSRQNPAFS